MTIYELIKQKAEQTEQQIQEELYAAFVGETEKTFYPPTSDGRDQYFEKQDRNVEKIKKLFYESATPEQRDSLFRDLLAYHDEYGCKAFDGLDLE